MINSKWLQYISHLVQVSLKTKWISSVDHTQQFNVALHCPVVPVVSSAILPDLGSEFLSSFYFMFYVQLTLSAL